MRERRIRQFRPWALCLGLLIGGWLTTQAQAQTAHAPAGGIVVNGKFYKGGQFIPSGSQSMTSGGVPAGYLSALAEEDLHARQAYYRRKARTKARTGHRTEARTSVRGESNQVAERDDTPDPLPTSNGSTPAQSSQARSSDSHGARAGVKPAGPSSLDQIANEKATERDKTARIALAIAKALIKQEKYEAALEWVRRARLEANSQDLLDEAAKLRALIQKKIGSN
jgi:hypothetical protein